MKSVYKKRLLEKPIPAFLEVLVNENGVKRFALTGGGGWMLVLPPLDDHTSMKIIKALLSNDSFEVIRRQSYTTHELISGLVQALRVSENSELDMGDVKISWGPYYGKPLKEIPSKWLLNEYRKERIGDFIVWEYVRKNIDRIRKEDRAE